MTTHWTPSRTSRRSFLGTLGLSFLGTIVGASASTRSRGFGREPFGTAAFGQ